MKKDFTQAPSIYIKSFKVKLKLVSLKIINVQ